MAASINPTLKQIEDLIGELKDLDAAKDSAKITSIVKKITAEMGTLSATELSNTLPIVQQATLEIKKKQGFTTDVIEAVKNFHEKIAEKLKSDLKTQSEAFFKEPKNQTNLQNLVNSNVHPNYAAMLTDFTAKKQELDKAELEAKKKEEEKKKGEDALKAQQLAAQQAEEAKRKADAAAAVQAASLGVPQLIENLKSKDRSIYKATLEELPKKLEGVPPQEFLKHQDAIIDAIESRHERGGAPGGSGLRDTYLEFMGKNNTLWNKYIEGLKAQPVKPSEQELLQILQVANKLESKLDMKGGALSFSLVGEKLLSLQTAAKAEAGQKQAEEAARKQKEEAAAKAEAERKAKEATTQAAKPADQTATATAATSQAQPAQQQDKPADSKRAAAAAAETKANADQTATGFVASAQTTASQMAARASDAGNKLAGLARNAAAGAADMLSSRITPALDAAKQQATDMVRSRFGKAAEAGQNAVMDVVAKHLATIPDLQTFLNKQFSERFPELGIVTQLINPKDPKAGLALLTNVAGAAAAQAVKFCTVLPGEVQGAYKFIFERSMDPNKTPDAWKQNIEKTIKAAWEAHKPNPIPYTGGTPQEVMEFAKQSELIANQPGFEGMKLQFDAASQAVLDEAKKVDKPNAPTLGGRK